MKIRFRLFKELEQETHCLILEQSKYSGGMIIAYKVLGNKWINTSDYKKLYPKEWNGQRELITPIKTFTINDVYKDMPKLKQKLFLEML